MPWSAGAVLTAAQLNTYAPQDYSAVVTPSVVNLPLAVASSHRYRMAGKFVVGEFYFQASASGTGTFSITLPVTARTAGGGQARGIGQAILTDVGVANYIGVVYLSSTTVAQVLLTSGVAASSTAPFTWGVNDVMAGTYVYEAA